ncbi:thyroid hormone receptor interactor 4 [Trypanosoma theileri]|uniref:Thyroid hormone receptor interactor 4 n=1 Tax=Trypanosoma theileri TaxID=67003 RepID=A0A1X0NNW7_9TRYP|nr:thyroid hormone receptor interactor 4 [Trypanosoma theileri]ORC86412.1 thyroid hormone receptor interactor 4 [Trypanosoma theileri]
MPAKRWGRPPTMSATEAHKEQLKRYIKNEIENNNLLGLLGEELDNMVEMLTTCNSRREVYDWCQTLMVGETLAAEVIRRRDDNGPPFEDTPGTKKRGATAGNSNSAANTNNNNNNSGGRQLSTASRRGGRKKDVSKNGGSATAVAATAKLKPGFCECGCFATEHNLRGNCANCGRIICEQESDEMCYHCGLDPYICVAYEIKVQDGLLTAAAIEKDRESYEKAISKRDELLQYAETRAKRTKVIDDQTAVFLSPQHAWMSPQEREKAVKDEALAEKRRKVAAMHRTTGAYTVHLDIMNQNAALTCQEIIPAPHSDTSSSSSESELGDGIDDKEVEIEEEEEVVRAVPLPSLMQKIWYSLDGSVEQLSTSGTIAVSSDKYRNAANDVGGADHSVKKPEVHRVVEISRRVQQDYYEDDARAFLDAQKMLQGEQVHQREDGLNIASEEEKEEEEDVDNVREEVKEKKENTVVKATEVKGNSSNSSSITAFIPTPIMRMNDNGICLSMHQPWAGLLVAGIKMHEGRVWSTNYRGRLWIHAASAQPHDIKEVEEHYAKFRPPTVEFPTHYPTGVLLGYVYIVDCMDQEKYRQTFPENERQEENSPFLFICVEAKTLPFPLPMVGNHKLFKLDHKVHTAARKQLLEI